MTKPSVYSFLKGKFLISDEAATHWRFILTCTLLAIIMIYSSHSAERKVHRIVDMQKEVKELKSEFIDARTTLINLKLESSIADKMKERGVFLPKKPPHKIIVGIK